MVFLPKNRSPGRLTSLGERGGILAMGLLLGLVLFLYFLPSHNTVHPSVPVIRRGPANVEAFLPDGQILAAVRDKTASDRSVIHADAIQHLLKRALNVTPDIAEALGMQDQQLPVDVLRGNPDHYRGRYLWYKGKLDYFEPTQTRHPVHGYSIYEGHLRIARQDQKPADVVFFYVSKPAAPQIKVGDFARIEGYFLKLRDEHLLAKAEKGPLLIGSQLKPDYPDWKAVEKLDLGVLGRVENAIWRNETWLHTRDVRLTLPESEDTPLWHLASFAMNQQALITEEEIRRVSFFLDENMLLEFKHGRQHYRRKAGGVDVYD